MSKLKDFGPAGENLAVKYLKSNQFKILDKNYRCSLGELDIVAREKETIVFVEVKTRKSSIY